jgi:hypothetical protein
MSASADEGHLGRDECDELHVGCQRQTRHVNDGPGDVVDVDRWLYGHRAIRLSICSLDGLR